MRTIELTGDIDENHLLQVRVPNDLPAGQVRLLVLVHDEDEGGTHWAKGIAEEWRAELADPREDIYTLADGKPVNEAR